MMRPAAFLTAAALVLLLAGCAAKRPAPPSAAEAKTLYATFITAETAAKNVKAFSMSGSMSFASGHKSGRLNFKFQGNLGDPLRLDLTTPMGGPFAFMREDGSEFLAYVPDRKTVYRHRDTRLGAARLGMPLPFTFRELAAILTGNFGEMVPADYASAKAVADGFEYRFSGANRLATLTLDFEGKPRHCTGRGVEPWRVDFEDDEAAPGLPVPVARKILLTTPGGAQVTLRIKSLAGRESPYPQAELELPVPAATASRPLDSGNGDIALPEF